MGWKPGQGVGPRLSKSEKLATRKSQNKVRIFGCALPNQETLRRETSDESEDDEELDPDVTFAPDDFDPWIVKPKDDCFGLGYSGLDRRPVLSSHIDLFGPPTSSLVMKEKKKKVNIRGQVCCDLSL
jgi:G patch domain-containing protein 1